jgi:hypothetical protein
VFVLQIKDCCLLTAILVLALMVITGCASIGPGKTAEKIAPPPSEIMSTEGWWKAKFRMQWPQDEEPSWYIDLLLAHKVVAPVLDRYEDNIYLWRFHRRAARDGAGHQFSFIFYAAAETAHHVYDTFRSDSLLNEMQFKGIINEIIFDNLSKVNKPNIEDTSDPHWPASIRKSWPYFIMGASQMWLKLVAETSADVPREYTPTSLIEIEAFYEEVNAAVISLWQKEGRHAFMHHLNALFGYEPVIFYEKRMLSF